MEQISLNLKPIMHHFKSEQLIPVSIAEAWDFFSNPANLIVLTNPNLKMKMESENGLTPIFAGKILKIRVKLFGFFPSSFLSEITEVEAPKFFIDTQLKGPFAFWQHKHLLSEIEGGTRITDEVTLKFPLGFLGIIAYRVFGKMYMKTIFDYRKLVLEKKFPG
ncbi:MAG: SRPBCC family protein [Bacteroidia bacterium]